MVVFLIFRIFTSCIFISLIEGQLYFPTPDAEVTDIFRTSAFFSPDFGGFPHYANPEENLVENSPKEKSLKQNEDSIAEGSEDQYSTSVVKNFYFHAAPEEEPVQRISKEIELGPPSVQNYKVIFIRAPVPPKKVINLKAIYRPPNEKTVVYVLHKKPEDVEIESVTSLPKNGKLLQPDVFFVKYNTGEEADDIQKNIQAQYNYLGGMTNVHKEEAAQILDDLTSSKDSHVSNIHMSKDSLLPDETENERRSLRRSVRYTQAISSTCFYC